MLSCKDVTARVSASLDRELPLRERLAVKLHLAMCVACRRMARQMALLSEASRRLAMEGTGKDTETLTHESKQRIWQQLQKAARNPSDPE
jgi:predicted anti-sigma-YlaC factor YlaD